MQQQRSIIDEFKHQYTSGGIVMKLIFINVIVFLIINILGVVGRLSGLETKTAIGEFVYNLFVAQTTPKAFIEHPWGMFTSMFSHYGFLHLLFNMVMLYAFGRMFVQFFSSKRLIYTYILGGIFGVLFEIGSHIFPTISSTSAIGASGSAMAVVFAVAAHKPQMEVNLYGTFKLKLFIIAAFLFFADFLSLGEDDKTGHFAHIGGAVIGYISVQQLKSSTNIVTMAARFGDWFLSLFRKRPKLSVDKGDTRRMSDEDYNQDKKQRQEQTDRILDKISKSGYESLSKKEKDFLFKQSK